MKRIKLTFWILGFGCGMIVAGMIGTLLSLNVNVEEKLVQADIATPQAENDQFIEEIPEVTNQGDSISEDKSENVSEDNIKEEATESSKESSDKESEQVRTITIPSNMSASEVCEILEKNGIVDDADSFLSYIKEMKRQTSIRSGEYTLPVGTSYDKLLSELI